MGRNKIIKKQEKQKEEAIEVTGIVQEIFANARVAVDIGDNLTVSGYIAGKMKQNHIKILVGDTVVVELSPYDLLNGRITKRIK